MLLAQDAIKTIREEGGGQGKSKLNPFENRAIKDHRPQVTTGGTSHVGINNRLACKVPGFSPLCYGLFVGEK